MSSSQNSSAQGSTQQNEEQTQKVNLSELGQFLQKRAAGSAESKWITIQPDETVFMEFDPNKIELVKRPNKFRDGQMTTRIRFHVIDGNGQERYFETSPTTADMLQTYLATYRRLKIQRKGEGKDTRYFAFPAE